MYNWYTNKTYGFERPVSKRPKRPVLKTFRFSKRPVEKRPLSKRVYQNKNKAFEAFISMDVLKSDVRKPDIVKQDVLETGRMGNSMFETGLYESGRFVGVPYNYRPRIILLRCHGTICGKICYLSHVDLQFFVLFFK
jgi:hypothetical protein